MALEYIDNYFRSSVLTYTLSLGPTLKAFRDGTSCYHLGITSPLLSIASEAAAAASADQRKDIFSSFDIWLKVASY